MQGATGGRVVFAILTVFAVIAWLWRLLSPTFRRFHEAADVRDAARPAAVGNGKVSVTKVLFGADKKVLLTYFLAIVIFYVGWNLLANTWGQFQTYMFSKARSRPVPGHRLGHHPQLRDARAQHRVRVHRRRQIS